MDEDIDRHISNIVKSGAGPLHRETTDTVKSEWQTFQGSREYQNCLALLRGSQKLQDSDVVKKKIEELGIEVQSMGVQLQDI